MIKITETKLGDHTILIVKVHAHQRVGYIEHTLPTTQYTAWVRLREILRAVYRWWCVRRLYR